jgi:hypothetical protein
MTAADILSACSAASWSLWHSRQQRRFPRTNHNQPSRFDLLIRHAHVFDGNGNPWIRAGEATIEVALPGAGSHPAAIRVGPYLHADHDPRRCNWGPVGTSRSGGRVHDWIVAPARTGRCLLSRSVPRSVAGRPSSGLAARRRSGAVCTGHRIVLAHLCERHFV